SRINEGPTAAADEKEDSMISADIVLRNGNILTLDGAGALARAVAIGNGRFIALGADAESLIGKNTTVFDLGGRTAIPGLFDSHIHPMLGALNALAVSLEQARSVADVQAALAERAAKVPPGTWIQGGSGWHESQL